jgi:signal transduction histidine kinase
VKPHFGPMTRTVRPSAAPLQSDTPGRKFELPAARNPALDERRRAFLRAISHELRTPLTSIIGFSEIIAAELYGPLGAPQYREYAEHVRRSGRRLLKLVNQVLEIARLEGGVADMALTPQPLVHLLDDVGDLLREDLLARNGRIVVADESDLPTVRVDARAARDLLFNLIQNALLHGPVDGAVEIRARQEGYQVVIEIEDAGPGVDPADIPGLLTLFPQDDPSSPMTLRIGLGLPIARLLAEAMGGGLALSSAEGRGLTAIVTLPAA